MGALGVAALVIMFLLSAGFAAVIVQLGSLPGNIAKKRGHPYAEVVNVASWVSIFTGVMWPFVFIWAFFPASARAPDKPDNAPVLNQTTEAEA